MRASYIVVTETDQWIGFLSDIDSKDLQAEVRQSANDNFLWPDVEVFAYRLASNEPVYSGLPLKNDTEE